MNNNIDFNEEQPREFNLENIFAENEYSIPIYQRNYAWENKQIEQLLSDIYDADSYYYLGTLVVDRTAPNVFTVIDGQQRLTTIFLLLLYLKTRRRSENFSKNSLRFEAREKSNRTLQDLYNLSENKELENDDFHSAEIIKGYNIIKKFFETEEAKAKTEEYLKKFCAKLKNIFIIRVQVPKQIDLNHYFEIMNTRGEQLEIHEIAKGRILSAIEKTADRNIAAQIWDKCAQMDTYIQMNFDKSTREKLFGEKWNSFTDKDFDSLRNKFPADNADEKKFSLIEELENPENSNSETDKNNDYEENERFESIVSFPNFLLIVNETLQNQNEENDSSLDDKKFLKILENNWKSNENALKFIFSLLKYRFLFDKFVLKREYAKDYKDDGKWSLQKLENNQDKPLYKLTYSSDENENDKKTAALRSLQSALRITYTSPKTMHWISKVLVALDKNQDADLIKVLENYACKKIEEANYLEAKGFEIERIVFTYLDYVLLRDGKVNIQDFQFQFRTSVEHFYPQHPEENETWSSDSLNSFGNLALITVSANSKFSNLNPAAKVSTYPETIRQSPKLQMMAEEMKNNANVWNEELSKNHNEEMLGILTDEIKKHNSLS